MKRLVKLSLLPLLVVTLTSCMGYLDGLINSGSLPISQGTSNPSGTKTITQVLTILTNAGYEDLDENNNSSQYTYYEGLIVDKYDLDLDVTGFYQGYVPSYTRWTMVVVFGNTSDAASYFQALQNDATVTSYLWLEGNIVIETASYETYLLFDTGAVAGSSILSSVSSTSVTSTTSSTSEATSATSTTSSASLYRTEAEMLAILTGAGYTDLSAYNDQDTRDYREEQYFSKYGLTLTVTAFYMGYIQTDTRWMQMEVFQTSVMGQQAYVALDNDLTVEGFVHYEGNIVVWTASPETWALFN